VADRSNSLWQLMKHRGQHLMVGEGALSISRCYELISYRAGVVQGGELGVGAVGGDGMTHQFDPWLRRSSN
jgi:uncharacterized membrane protein YjdF